MQNTAANTSLNAASVEFQGRLDALRQDIDSFLMESANASYPANLYQPMKYFLEFGGKRLRPLLTLLACKAVSGSYKQASSAGSFGD